MNKYFKSLALALASLVVAGAAQAGIVISIVPSSITVAQSTVFTMAVRLSGLDSSQTQISGFDFHLFFDDSLVEATDVTLNSSVFSGPGNPPLISYAGAGVTGGNYVDFAFDPADLIGPQSAGSFDLLTLEFKSRGTNGATLLSFGASPLFDRNLMDFDGVTLAADYGSACIIVGEGDCNRVPEPGSSALAGIGLLAACLPMALRRRRQTS